MLGDELPRALKVVDDLGILQRTISDMLLRLGRLDRPHEPKVGRLLVFLLSPAALLERITKRLYLGTHD